MTIDEAIKRAEEAAECEQKVVDTHYISDDVSIDEIFCDDTEIIEEHLAVYKKGAEEDRQLAEWLTDYKRLLEQKPCEEVSEKLQKIEQIIEEHDKDRMPEDYWYIDRIREVIKE